MSYSYQGTEKKTAKGFGKELNISPKHANEVCYAVRGMAVGKALSYLDRVVEKQDFVPFRRYKKKIAHRSGGTPGRYPEKAARAVGEVIKNARSNAEYKGMNPEKLQITHATAYKAIKLDRMKPKGRARPHNIKLTNIEVVVKEV
jgi:large subunit ribosomal protein L22